MRFLCLLLAALAFTQVHARDLYLQLHAFEWTERAEGRGTLLEEEGTLLGLGLAGNLCQRGALRLPARAELFAGEVTYDGSTQLGSALHTTTLYVGGKIEAEGERAWSLSEGLAAGPLAGLGLRSWLRRLDNSERNSTGYDEAWLTAYARLGAFAEGATAATPTSPWRVEAGLHLPFYNTAYYSLESPLTSETASVSPGLKPSLFAEASVRGAGWFASLRFEELLFGASDPEPLPPFEIFQPESEGRLVSLQAGLTW